MEEYTGTPVYIGIKDANRILGFGYTYLYNGCRNNSIPHIMAGSKYLIDVPRFLEKLREKEEGA